MIADVPGLAGGAHLVPVAARGEPRATGGSRGTGDPGIGAREIGLGNHKLAFYFLSLSLNVTLTAFTIKIKVFSKLNIGKAIAAYYVFSHYYFNFFKIV